MINKHTAYVLRERLFLCVPYMKPEHVAMLAFKWGANDGMFHSVKAVSKQFQEIDAATVARIEADALNIMDNELRLIYSCVNCGQDLRKVGVRRKTIGIEMVDMYISEDGNMSRTTHEAFSGNKQPTYECLACSRPVSPDDRVAIFLNYGITDRGCHEYVMQFYEVEYRMFNEATTNRRNKQSTTGRPIPSVSTAEDIYTVPVMSTRVIAEFVRNGHLDVVSNTNDSTSVNEIQQSPR